MLRVIVLNDGGGPHPPLAHPVRRPASRGQAAPRKGHINQNKLANHLSAGVEENLNKARRGWAGEAAGYYEKDHSPTKYLPAHFQHVGVEA